MRSSKPREAFGISRLPAGKYNTYKKREKHRFSRFLLSFPRSAWECKLDASAIGFPRRAWEPENSVDFVIPTEVQHFCKTLDFAQDDSTCINKL